jgi:hypothetical protein
MAKPSKSQRNYQKDLEQMYQLESILTDDKSPLVGHLKQYLSTYQGKVSPEQYQQVGKEEAYRWIVNNMFGGSLPSAEEASGPITDTEINSRAAAMAADPKYSNGKTAEELAALIRQNGGSPLERQMKALELVRSFIPPTPEQPDIPQPPAAAPPVAKLASGAGKVSYTPMRAKKATKASTPDQKLAEAQLMMLEDLAEPRMRLEQ